MTATGRGITNMRLALTDFQGNVRTTVSTAFGYYRFDEVEAGATYIITATGKRYSFNQPSQVLNASEDNENIDFIGYSSKFLR